MGFITSIVPVTITASGFERSSRHATPGKRLLCLAVERSIGGGVGFARSLVRNGRALHDQVARTRGATAG